MPVSFAALAATATTDAGAAPAAASTTATTVLPSDVIDQLSRFADTGRVPAKQQIGVGVGLERPNLAGEAAYMKAEYSKGSPDYHRFVTPAEFDARFGVPRSEYNALVTWLLKGGLSVTPVQGDTDYVLASGSAQRVESLFKVQIDTFDISGKTYYANVDAPSVPANLDVLAVSGLDDIQGPRLLPNKLGSNSVNEHPDSLEHGLEPNDIGTGTCVAVFATQACISDPEVLSQVYDAPANDAGQGQSMAIFGWGVTNDDQLSPAPDNYSVQSDLTQFEEQWNLPAIALKINYYGTEPITDTSGSDEWRLDTQASTGLAPDVTGETMYLGNAGNDPDLIGAYTAWANDPSGPLQGSSSFGGCEDNQLADTVGQNDPTGLWGWENPNQVMYEQALTQAVAEGRTMFASTGDTANGCPLIPTAAANGVSPFPTPVLNYPAVSPNVVAVGGTVLDWTADTSTTYSRAFELGWEYGGGGPDLFIPAPAYQTRNLNVEGVPDETDCLVNDADQPYDPPQACRSIPDVAAQSGDYAAFESGYGITLDGQNNTGVLGTSLSSPLWLATWTRVQAAAPAGGLGFADNIIYALGNSSTGANDFFDEGGTSGQTAVTCNGAAPVYCTRPGYDYVTGWGSPDISNLAKDATGNTSLAPTNPTTPNAPPSAASTPPNIDACAALWSDPSNTEMIPYVEGTGASESPQLDIVGGNMSLSPDGQDLVTTLTIQDLNTEPAGGTANDYVMTWNWGNDTFFTQANVDVATGAVTYMDGTGAGVPAGTLRSTSDTGTFTPGANGTITVDVPLNDITEGGQAATTGIVFSGINAWSGLEYGAAADSPAGYEGVVDLYASKAVATYDYQVGETCGPGGGQVPEAPYALAIPLLGLGIAGGIVWRRRRRRPSGTTSADS